jgi:hypothetical protein
MTENSRPSCIASPGPELSAFVAFFWSYEGYAAPHARERLLPTGKMGLFFTLDSEGAVAAGVSGAYSEAVVLDTSRPFSIIGVQFKAGGGFPFFAGPSDELHNCSVSLDQVWGASGASLRDRLWEATTPQQRFRIDPNRFNPPGTHSHSPPLHQAIAGGHLNVVKLLIDRGARLDIRDTIYQGTPLELRRSWRLFGSRCDLPRIGRSRAWWSPRAPTRAVSSIWCIRLRGRRCRLLIYVS